MQKLIIFDFNRTLYDPDAGTPIPGALDLCEAATAKGYTLVVVGKAAPSREGKLRSMGLIQFFAETHFVEHKSAELFADIMHRFDVSPAETLVIGDRTRGELAIGHELGAITIWLQAGKFADEHPDGDWTSAHVVATLGEIEPLL